VDLQLTWIARDPGHPGESRDRAITRGDAGLISPGLSIAD
jgi:hypothetical protein